MKTAFDVARRTNAPSLQGQRGVTLIIALLVLVAMTLAGLALVRSVDSATLLAGNLAFSQSATASADWGMEKAIGDLRGMASSALESDSSADGYFASVPWDTATKSPKVIDFTGSATADLKDDFDWKTAVTVAGADAAGNTAAYVIHRLCQGSGTLDPATCTTWQEIATPQASEGMLSADETYRDPTMTGGASAMHGLYRVTVRISGPRNTFSYIQAIVIV
jgi:type IV pilus assembly protein PilX